MKRIIFTDTVKLIGNTAWLLVLLLSLVSYVAFSSVQTKQFSSNINMCKSGGYVTLSDLIVYEQNKNDFDSASATQTYTIAAPTGFQFKSGVGSVVFSNNTDFSLKSLTITSSGVVLSVSISTISNIDTVIFKGLQIEVTTAGFSGANLNFNYTSGQPLNNGISNLYFAHLNPQNSSTAFSLGSLDTMCVNGGSQSLTGLGTPSGGTFSGTGITGGNTFNPSTAGTGSFPITYTDPTGCTATATVAVLSSPVLNFSSIAANQLCSGNNTNISLANTGSPRGGTFSGIGVSSNNFNPKVAGPGSTVITYSVTGCGSVTGIIKVNETPEATFFGLASSYCNNAADVSLTGYPSGGTFSGNGMNDTIFQPSNVGTGSTSITYTYSANGCSGSYKVNTNILQAPTSVSILLNPNSNNYSSNQDTVQILGSQSPSGGQITVSGNGVSTNNGGKSYFNPNTIGNGKSTITRTYTLPDGCTASASVTVNVSQPNAGSINGLNSLYCNSSPSSFLFIPKTSNLVFGTFSAYYISGGSAINDYNVLTAINDTSATFNPSQAVSGQTYYIYFYGYNNLFEYIDAFAQTIIETVPSVTITNIDSIYCSSASQTHITYTTSTGIGTVTFSGNAVNNNNFIPAAATAGIPTTINYQYSDINGCSSNGGIKTTVYPAPSSLAYKGLATSYCISDQAAHQLSPSPSVTPSGTSAVFSGVGLDIGGTFTASKADLQGKTSRKYYFTATYTSPHGCIGTYVDSTIVYALPSMGLSGIDSQYCNNVAPINLQASASPAGGTFTINPLSSALNGSTFSPQIASTNPGIYEITYTYTDLATHCVNDTSLTTIVRPIPILNITNLNNEYCYSSPSYQLNGLPVGGTFSSPTASIASGIFNPSASDVGSHFITYSYTDQYGCSNSVTNNTVIYGIPELGPIPLSIKSSPHFHMSSVCENDLIKLTDSLSIVDTKNNASSYIQNAVWNIDGFSQDTIPFLAVKLDSFAAGFHTIKYTLLTNKNCSNSIQKSFTIGSYPKTSFTYDKICNLDSTSFVNTSTINIGIIDTVRWDFSDQTPVLTKIYNSNKLSILHQFADTGTYNIILKTTTNFNCTSTDSQKIFILPAVTITNAMPYASDFEQNSGGWISSGVTDTISTWARGIAQKTVINTAAFNNHVWVTNLNGNFKPNEISYMYSPCFNFQDVSRPMIHFDYWSSVPLNESGTNLQYTLDGSNWLVLGTPNTDGINWYNNTTNIISRPAGTQALNQDGWTGMDTSLKNTRHILDDIIGNNNNNIRFRISFAGTQNVSNGFAFDNMWIGDRSRLMLLEHFTNASNPSSVVTQENSYVNGLVDNATNDTTRNVVALEYHTSFGGLAPIYTRNIPDEGARSLYYGVSQVPQSNLDGSYYSGSGLLISQNMLNTRTLYDPAFGIKLNTGYNASALTVNGTISLQSKIIVSNAVTLYISLAERKVTLNNPAETFEWVHSKFLPDAAGTSFAANWTVGQTQNIPFSWTFPSGYLFDPTQLMIIVFVQDNVTKEIYQTAYKALGSNAVVTSVFNPSLTTSTISLFPNPANDLTSVVLNGTLSSSYSWNVIDELGRVVDQGILQPNVDGFSINTTAYASGFYTLRLSNSSDGVKAVKFVVVH